MPRPALAALTIAFVACSTARHTVIHGERHFGGGLNDTASHPPPPITLPAAGGAYVDPVFGTTIVRVTDETRGTHCVHAYSYWPALNADDTRLLLSCDGQPQLYRFDPATLAVRYDRAIDDDGGPRIQFEGATWSHVDPDLLYALDADGRALLAIDVRRGTTRTLHSARLAAGEKLAQLSVSDDARVFVATIRAAKGEARRGVFAWDRRTGRALRPPAACETKAAAAIDEAKVDKRGRVVMINRADDSFTLWDLTSGATQEFSHHVEADAASGHYDLGARFVASGDGWHAGVALRGWDGLRAAHPVLAYEKVDGKQNWAICEHVSLRADAERFVVVSTYCGDGTWAPFEKEILLAFTDGSGFVRLAHTRSDGASPDEGWRYYAQPRAVVDRRGRYVVFTSDLGSPSRTDVMLLVIPERYW